MNDKFVATFKYGYSVESIEFECDSALNALRAAFKAFKAAHPTLHEHLKPTLTRIELAAHTHPDTTYRLLSTGEQIALRNAKRWGYVRASVANQDGNPRAHWKTCKVLMEKGFLKPKSGTIRREYVLTDEGVRVAGFIPGGAA